MKNPITKTLKYPRNLFSKKEVLKKIKNFCYPKAWKYKSGKKIHYLMFSETAMKKHYL